MKKILFYEYITYACVVFLILLIVVWNVFLSPPENLPRVIPAILYNIPLLIIMVKLNKNNFSTYIITSYVMLFYFVIGVGNTTTQNSFNFGIIIAITSLAAFTSSIFYVRERDKKSIKD